MLDLQTLHSLSPTLSPYTTLFRSVQGRAGERVHLRRDCRGEEQGLTLDRQLAEDAAYVRGEAHVQHAVGFVQDEDLEPRIVDVAALHVVEQPARRGDDDVHTAAQRLRLRLEPHAAIDRGGA